MKFQLRMTADSIPNEDTGEFLKSHWLEQKNKLEALGFTFGAQRTYWYKNNTHPIYIELDTTEQIINFIEEWGEVIIGPSDWGNAAYFIEIYNDYRE